MLFYNFGLHDKLIMQYNSTPIYGSILIYLGYLGVKHEKQSVFT